MTALRTPKMRHNKAANQAFVELDSHRHYLGVWGKPATVEAYHRTIAEWLANGRRVPVAPNIITVIELLDAYFDYAAARYVDRDGNPTSEMVRVKAAMRPLRDLYGMTPAAEFGPKGLRAIQERLVNQGKEPGKRPLSRRVINTYIGIVRRIFKWAVSRETIPPTVHQGLLALEGLRFGQSDARETDRVLPVRQEDIDAVRPRVSRQVRALIDLQLLTGARPGELVALRPCDFDTTSDVWTVRPERHKTAHKGRERVLYFGPRAQAILKPFMLRGATCFLFSPVEAERERHAAAESHRRPDQKCETTKTDRTLGPHYMTNSYRRAIERACTEAKVPVWSPHRLRHNAATLFRRVYGLDAAQVLLGHAQADVTQVYAELDHTKAVEIIRQIG